jgi:outer membrane beta-barrel protein
MESRRTMRPTTPTDAEGVAMKQAGRWLLLAVALALIPQAAYAQKKKPTNAGATPAAAADTPAPVNADADSDQPAATPPSTPAAGAETPPPADATGGAGAAGVDICQVTPDAPQCQVAKEVNMASEAEKPIHAEIYAVQQQYVLKSQRFEIMPYFSVTLNDQFVSHNAPGLALNYYITQVLAVGLNGVWYDGLNADSDFNFQNRRAARIAAPLNIYQFSGDLNFTYVPMYGKFAGFGDFIFHYDAYIDGGLGVIRTKPEAVIDPDNRKFDWKTNINFDVGIGLRIFFNRWLAAVLEVRDIMYVDQLEATTIAKGQAVTSGQPGYANSPLNPATWYGPNEFTNNVQMQVGLSFFLPTSFEYRLPK